MKAQIGVSVLRDAWLRPFLEHARTGDPIHWTAVSKEEQHDGIVVLVPMDSTAAADGSIGDTPCLRIRVPDDDPNWEILFEAAESWAYMILGDRIVHATDMQWAEWGDRQVRVVRTLVYEGPAGWLRDQLARSLPIGRRAGKQGSVTVYQGRIDLVDDGDRA